MSLRELSEQQLGIMQLVSDGDLTLEDVQDHLDLIKESKKDKIESILFVLSELDSKMAAQKAESERLANMAEVTSNSIARLKEYLLCNMESGDKYEFDLFKVTCVKGRDVVEVDNEDAVSTDYKVHKPETWSLDKRKILSDLKAGESIEGAKLVEGKRSLRIT